jgi:hypothetical protein
VFFLYHPCQGHTYNKGQQQQPESKGSNSHQTVMGMSSVGLRTKDHCAGEVHQQQFSSQSVSQSVSQWSVMHELQVMAVCGWLWQISVVSSHYLAMTSDKRKTNTRLCVCCSCSDLYSVCKLVKLSYSFVVMSYRHPINPITNLCLVTNMGQYFKITILQCHSSWTT